MNGLTNHVLMVRPYFFKKNEETTVNNYFQKNTSLNDQEINDLAKKEFDKFVIKLLNAGLRITVYQDKKYPQTPDSLFPNNWVSFHKTNKVILYPMFAQNRRNERTDYIFDKLKKQGVEIEKIYDFTNFENENLFLEGTGSMVLDRVNKKCYACLSERTCKDLVIDFCFKMKYKPILFKAYHKFSKKKLSIYHTNVMMSIGQKFAAVGLDSIHNIQEKENLINELYNDGKEIISLSENQIKNFAGNMLLLHNSKEPILVMSSSAYNSLTKLQIKKFEKYSKIISVDLKTIERVSGGSARCMLAEIF
tara:strand:+ start:3180 stop:4097 length:918 start_codon:yes stop_codon:yes gene_type:complete